MSVVIPSLRGAIAVPEWAKNELWRKAHVVPSLDLRFAESKSLVDATTGTNLIDFTRASSGTYVGSDGLIKTATTNLLLRSEEFDQSPWLISGLLAFGSGSTPNAILAPNETLTADQITEDTTGNLHTITQNVSTSAGATVAFSIFAKSAGRNFIRLVLRNSASASDSALCFFDLSSGIAGSPITGGAGIQYGATIQAFGDGWYRCSLIGSVPTATTYRLDVTLANSISNVFYTGDGTSGIYIWGAQLEQSTTVGEYIPTTSTINSAPRFDHDPTTGESLGLLVEEQRTNSLVQSENFATTWTSSNGTLTVDQTVAPTGATTADLFTGNAGTGIKRLRQNITTTSLGPWTFSIWLKGNTAASALIVIFDSSVGGVNHVRTTLSFSTGALSGTTAGGTATGISTSVQNFGNGWYRVSITGTFVTALTSVWAEVWLDGYTSTAIETSFYLWGAQLEAGSFPTSYIPTTSSTVTRAADVASISGSNFSSWYNATQGTVFTSQKTPVTNGQQGAYWFSTPPTVGRGIAGIIDTRDVAQRLTVYNRDDVAVSSLNVSPLIDGQQQNIAHSWSGGTQSASLNGLLNTGSYNAIYPGISQLSIGFSEISAGSPQYLSGTIRRLTFWPARLPNETLQTITQ